MLRFLRIRLKRAYVKFNPLDYPSLFADDAMGWQESRAYLLEIAQSARDRGISFLVVIYPELVDLDNGHPHIYRYEIV